MKKAIVVIAVALVLLLGINSCRLMLKGEDKTEEVVYVRTATV